MMHRCSSSSQGNNMMGQCTCGLFHTQTNSFTMLFSMPNNHHHHESDMYPFASSSSFSSSSASVDCTLSLGTPSTRLCEDDEKSRIRHENRSSFCWDILQTKNTPYSSQTTHKTANTRGTNTNNNSNSTSDPLLARRCANCDTTSTPLWRNGPRGPKSLCNACGIRFKKEERRATAANGGGSGSSSSTTSMEQHYYGYGNNNTMWVQTAAQKMPCYSPANEFRFIEESDGDSDSSGIPFLSWRLNVTDRPSLVHDFTR